ncbi:MAG: ABC transporter permease subunit [Planctomycetes bacterium]|nr:ABC transporter permease subunit [Planctomycetota bacterium]
MFRTILDRLRGRWHGSDVAVLLGLVAFVASALLVACRWFADYTPAVEIRLSPLALPGYALLSLSRALVSYVICIGFALLTAYASAHSARVERILIPLLDVGQSLPILAFMPGFVLALIALFPHSNVGLELTSVLMLFTCQAWNLCFGFYYSLRAVPHELREVADVYRAGRWRTFRCLELPSGVLPLVWNSVLSVAGGWFFLEVCENFKLGSRHFRLPGLGAYLGEAERRKDVAAVLLAIGAMGLIVLALDLLLWRPLIVWAQRFKLEESGAEDLPRSKVLDWFRESKVMLPAVVAAVRGLVGAVDAAFVRASHAAAAATAAARLDEHAAALTKLLDRFGAAATSVAGALVTHRAIAPAARRLSLAVTRLAAPGGGQRLLLAARGTLRRTVFGGAAAVGLAAGAWLLALLCRLELADWGRVILYSLYTLGRVLAAVGVATLWTVPVGVAIGSSPRLARVLQPMVQFLTSFPASMLFPLASALFLEAGGSLNILSVLLMILGGQWYILFNIVSGAMAIPADLRVAADVYRLQGWRRWKALILPAIFPSLVTGWVTAAGGSWNASIITEYFEYGNEVHKTKGLGALITQSATEANYPLLAASSLTMALVVVAMNRVFWLRVTQYAERRYSLTA